MSRKIRKGNDIDINWSLLDKDRNPYIVEGRNFAIELLVGNTKRVRISDATASGNTIHFTYYGKDQKVDGPVNLIYIENGGEVDMVTFDTKDAFTMVPHSWLAVDDDETPETVTLDVVTVVSELNSSIGPRGYSAYEIAVQHGETRTEEEWLASLKPLITADENGNVYCDGVLLTDVIYRVVSTVSENEQERVEAERLREEQAEADHAQAERDHAAADEDHDDAETDHTRAERDHELAEEAIGRINQLGPATESKDGLMSAGDKVKLNGVEQGAQKNVLETVKVDGTALPVDGDKAVNITLPDVSQFITKAVNDLLNYYTKTEVDAKIAAIKQFTIQSVSALPQPSAETVNILYLVPAEEPKTANEKDEFITVLKDGSYVWEQVGSTAIDLSGYVTTDALNTALAGYVTSGALQTALAGKQDKIDSSHKLDYSLLENTPTIPAAQVPADWDATTGVARILNKPTIPAAPVNADWNADSGLAQILNKPTIPTQYAGSPTAGGFANKTVAIPFGNVDSTSTATEITATVDNFPETLTDGVCAFIRNNVVASASGWTLNINGTGAKPVYASNADATRTSTIFTAAVTYLFIYNSTRVEGGCWDMYYGYNANDNTIGYNLRTNAMSLPVTSACYRYRLLFTSADGTHFVPANASSSTNATAKRTTTSTPIDPFGSIRYYGYTTAVSSGARPGATYLWEQYSVTLGYSFNRTGAALTLTAWKPVYIKCTPQTDGSAIIDAEEPYVQDLPTTADGFIYIYLGVAYSATNVELTLYHPVYYHDGNSLRLWTGISDIISIANSEIDTIMAS